MTPKTTSKILGTIETNIVARLTYEKKTIITTEDFDRLFNLSPNDRKQVVFRLKKKKILPPIKRGVYAFSPLEAGPEGTGLKVAPRDFYDLDFVIRNGFDLTN